MVFYNSDFPSIKDAQGQPDGLVVLAYFFEVCIDFFVVLHFFFFFSFKGRLGQK